FSIRVLNGVLRAPEPGSMNLIWNKIGGLPESLVTSSLLIEKLSPGEPFDLAIRDGKSGFVFFNIEGDSYDFSPACHTLTITGGRLVLSDELAGKLGQVALAGVDVGGINIKAAVYPIEITNLENGAVKSTTLPARSGVNGTDAPVPGPDIIVGDMTGLQQFGS